MRALRPDSDRGRWRSARWCSSAAMSCCSGMPSGFTPRPSRCEARPRGILPGAFYVWVNCFGVIAPVQAWSFANQLFDTRQARRLFGLIAVGASLGSIGAGLLARVLVRPIGGAVNMMLVLAGLILARRSSCRSPTSSCTSAVDRRGSPGAAASARRQPRADRRNAVSAVDCALVFLAAITTQWSGFQLSLVASQRFHGDANMLTRFFGTFNFALGRVSFVLQLALVGPTLRRFGLAVTILVLPLALGTGSFLILLLPALLDGAPDQRARSGPALFARQGDLRASLPAAGAGATSARSRRPSTSSSAAWPMRSARCSSGWRRRASSCSAGWGWRFAARPPSIWDSLAAWVLVAARLRGEYVRTIQSSIHRHRIASRARARRPAGSQRREHAGRRNLRRDDPGDVRYALDWLEAQGMLGLDTSGAAAAVASRKPTSGAARWRC